MAGYVVCSGEADLKLAYCDTETFCERPLKDGVFQYAEKAEVLLFSYAIDDGEAAVWDLTTGEAMPNQLEDAICDERVLTVWHNGRGFDLPVMKFALPYIYNMLPIERVYDTMCQALAHGLPGGLDALCEVMGVAEDERKLKTGREFINLFCKNPAKNMKRPRATRLTHPKEWIGFKEYARMDIPSMRAIHKKMPLWNYPYKGSEMDLSRLDYKINNRGFLLDLDLAHAAIRAVDREQKILAKRTVELTNGEVEKATQRDKLLAHLLAEYGVELPDLQKSTLERRIQDTDLPWALRELLAIRLQASSSSTSKYRTAIKGASSDGRARGCLQFDGASRTRRWSGRLIQPHNYVRPNMKPGEIEVGIAGMKADCEDLLYPNVMRLAANSMRGTIIAPKGKKLVAADLSNIEGRDTAWLAGEEWKLQAFRDYDTIIGTDEKGKPIRKGHDIYKLAYAKSFGVDPSLVDDAQRQVGKVQELALGFGGGVGAFLQFSLVYNLDLEEMAEEAEAAIPGDVWTDAEAMYQWTLRKKRSTFGLSRRAWTVCESFVLAWRKGHPEIAGVKGDDERRGLWGDMEDAVKSATQNPGVTFQCRSMRVRRDGMWLRIRLPSGNFLCYPSPRIDGTQWSYMGVNQYSRKWSRIKSFGGKLAENAAQSLARDFLANAMPLAEAADYEIILTVHDEILSETPDSPEFNTEHLSSILSTVPSWAPGMPLAAAGFESYRYKKG